MTVNLNGTDYELPEITQEITDKYPYYYIIKADIHVIMTVTNETILSEESVAIYASNQIPVCMYGTVGDLTCNYATLSDPAALGQAYVFNPNTNTWDVDGEETSGENYAIPIGRIEVPANPAYQYVIIFTKFYVNYDLKTKDTDKIVFYNSEKNISEAVMSSEWFREVANQMRRISNSDAKMFLDDMLNVFKQKTPSNHTSIDSKGLIQRSLSSISDAGITEVKPYALAGFNYAFDISLPNATKIDTSGLASNLFTQNYDLPLVEYAGTTAFGLNIMLKEITLPSLKTANAWIFFLCSNLKKIDLSVAESLIQPCYGSACNTLIIRSPQVCKISNIVPTDLEKCLGGDYDEEGTEAYIYVPLNLVDSYKADAAWFYYSDRIRAIEDYPEICGTSESEVG